MEHAHPLPAPDDVRACGAMVVLLHPHGAEDAGLALMRGWGPTVPMAVVSALPIAGSARTGQAYKVLIEASSS